VSAYAEAYEIRSRRVPGILFTAFVLFSAGCATPKQKAADNALREAHIDPATAGVVSGRVLFSGPAPKRLKLDLSANPTCEREHLKPVYSEQVVVNKNCTLRNTLIWIKGGLTSVRWRAPAAVVALDQVGCVYQPHALALMTGQTLEISNSDPLNHNVHAQSSANVAFNVAQPPRAEKLYHRFDREELMIPVTCGVHPWMTAYISVISHPFFAVTGDDGTFELRGLPAGRYVLEAVHERYGHREMAFTIAAKERKMLDFTYAQTSAGGIL